MIRTLRRKFIAIAMLSLLGTLIVLCGAIAVGNAYVAEGRADRVIELLYENAGEFPAPPEARPATKRVNSHARTATAATTSSAQISWSTSSASTVRDSPESSSPSSSGGHP